ncbi:hypothetical protein GCM10027258_56940 [Amycolatopsis stemonae]
MILVVMLSPRASQGGLTLPPLAAPVQGRRRIRRAGRRPLRRALGHLRNLRRVLVKNRPGVCSEAVFRCCFDQPAMLPSPAFAAPDGTLETCGAGTVNWVR